MNWIRLFTSPKLIKGIKYIEAERTNKHPVNNSTKGYRNEICAEQFEHLPLRIIKANKGILQYHRIGDLQLGQNDEGFNIESPSRGNR
ncbi:MAG: hypothetical protein V1871_06855 [Planctomycetota bacterium]